MPLNIIIDMGLVAVHFVVYIIFDIGFFTSRAADAVFRQVTDARARLDRPLGFPPGLLTDFTRGPKFGLCRCRT